MLKLCMKYSAGNKAYEYYREELNENEKIVYDEIKESYLQFNTKFTTQVTNLKTQELSRAFQAVVLDHPEIFWIGSFSQINIYEYKAIYLNYSFSKEEALAQKEKIEEKYNEIISEANNKLTNYEKIKYVHDELINMSIYNIDYPTEQNNKYQSMVSIFEDGNTVCVGYAHAFKFIMDELGIKSIIVKEVNEENPLDSHVWNMVELNWNWKHLDITWDKQLSKKTTISYEFFLNDEDEFYINNRIQNHNIKNSIQGL